MFDITQGRQKQSEARRGSKKAGKQAPLGNTRIGEAQTPEAEKGKGSRRARASRAADASSRGQRRRAEERRSTAGSTGGKSKANPRRSIRAGGMRER